MIKHKFFILIILFYCGTAYAVPNLTFVKEELQNYYDSGSYFTDMQSVLNTAKQDLINIVKSNSQHEKLAIVLDIDDTAISNYADLKSVDFGGNYDMRYQLLLKGDEPALEPTLSLYNLALEENVDVFFITGRAIKVKELTEKVLKKAGYTKWTNIYFKTDEYKNASATDFKTAIRKKISADGYKIVENVGDQYSDLKGGYSLYQYKLPNPFYYIP